MPLGKWILLIITWAAEGSAGYLFLRSAAKRRGRNLNSRTAKVANFLIFGLNYIAGWVLIILVLVGIVQSLLISI
jgi:hypothetical protein